MKSELRKEDALWFYAMMTMGKDISIDGCINTAYRDFCRTLHGIRNNDHKTEMKSEASDIIRGMIVNILGNSVPQDEFNKLHESACNDIKTVYLKNQTAFFIGQAQKWINMSFKYVYMLYLADLLKVSKTGIDIRKHNYRHFHLPIDNIVLQHQTVKRLYSQHIGNAVWSKIDDYANYLVFQKHLKKEVKIPLIVFEGQIWNPPQNELLL